MKNYNEWLKIRGIRKKCEDFSPKWNEIMSSQRMDKKYLSFSTAHDGGIRLHLAAYAGEYGSSTVSNYLPSDEIIRECLVRVLDAEFPAIWKKTIEAIQTKEKVLHAVVLKELEDAKIVIENES